MGIDELKELLKQRDDLIDRKCKGSIQDALDYQNHIERLTKEKAEIMRIFEKLFYSLQAEGCHDDIDLIQEADKLLSSISD